MNINEITVNDLNAADDAFGDAGAVRKAGRDHDKLGEKILASTFFMPVILHGASAPPEKFIALGIDIGLKLAERERLRLAKNEAIAA